MKIKLRYSTDMTIHKDKHMLLYYVSLYKVDLLTISSFMCLISFLAISTSVAWPWNRAMGYKVIIHEKISG